MSNNKAIFDDIIRSVGYIQKVKNDKEMGSAYVDSYMTKQQILRDKKVTELLGAYVQQYKDKIKDNRRFKNSLFYVCLVILLAFAVSFIVEIFMIGNADIENMPKIIELISVCVTFLTLIVSMLTIITKYVFLKKEDEYITRIVELIQKNDLENKKENIKARISGKETDENTKKEESQK